jgi:class 3 adenylate cyclase
VTEPIGPLELKGFHEPVQAYNVIGPRDEGGNR